MPTYVCSAAIGRLTPVQKAEIVRSTAPMVVEPVVETAAAETMGCEGSAARSTAPNCG